MGAGGGQLRIRLTVMAWRGEGTVPAAVEPVPDGSAAAGRIGLVPPGRRTRSRCGSARGGKAHDGRGGAHRPDAVADGEAGDDVIDYGQQRRTIFLELDPGLTERKRQKADLGLADGLLAAGISGQCASGQSGKNRAAQDLASIWSASAVGLAGWAGGNTTVCYKPALPVAAWCRLFVVRGVSGVMRRSRAIGAGSHQL